MKFGVSMMMMMGLTLGFGLKAHALCVMMQNFEYNDPTFVSYPSKGLYYPNVTKSLIVDGHGIPMPTKVEVAGEPCYIFSSYKDLDYYLKDEKKLLQGRSYTYHYHDGTGERDLGWTFPVVAPDEPIIIHQIAHGDRTGIVCTTDPDNPGDQQYREDPLAFAKQWGSNHQIALTSLSCYSSDLIARSLLDQEKDPQQAYIQNFCVMTLSPFSHTTVPIDDSTTASFILGMRDIPAGTSFAQYFLENNYYENYAKEKRPLGICSAANWGEMGLVDYLECGKDIFNFDRLYRDYAYYQSEEQKAAYFQCMHQEDREKSRTAAAINFLGHFDELLNASNCRKETISPSYAADMALYYYAASEGCNSLAQITDAQYCLPNFHLGTNFLTMQYRAPAATPNVATADRPSSAGDDANNSSYEDYSWEKNCQNNEEIKDALRTWKNAKNANVGPAQDINELKDRFVTVAMKYSYLCRTLECQGFVSPQYTNILRSIADEGDAQEFATKGPEKFRERLQAIFAKNAYTELLSKMVEQELHLAWPPEEIEKEIDKKMEEFVEANGLNYDDYKVDCAKMILDASAFTNPKTGEQCSWFTLAPPPVDLSNAVQECRQLYRELQQKPPKEWEQLPTIFRPEEKKADLLSMILLGAVNVSTGDGLAINGAPATSMDVYNPPFVMTEMEAIIHPARGMASLFFHVMDEAMRRPPKKEFPLDVKRRKACENFKLGEFSPHSK